MALNGLLAGEARNEPGTGTPPVPGDSEPCSGSCELGCPAGIPGGATHPVAGLGCCLP